MVKIKNLDTNFERDLARCASTYLLIERCPGGRPIVDGYICPHCNYDTTDGDCGGVEGFNRIEKVR